MVKREISLLIFSIILIAIGFSFAFFANGNQLYTDIGYIVGGLGFLLIIDVLVEIYLPIVDRWMSKPDSEY